jgi:GntR family transcriptional regulator, carbon starvation induced regulator
MLERLNATTFPEGRDDHGASPEPLTNVALRTLRDDIICGKLKPGSRLRVGKLRDTYGIGASPLREALSRLVPSGFVVSLERRGFMVAPLSLREFREMTDVRKLLEKESIKLSLSDGDDDWEARVVSALHRLSKLKGPGPNKMSQAMKEWEGLNESFYEALVAGCSSVWLLNFRRSAYYYAKRYLRVCLSASTLAEVQKDHRAMADAAIRRNVPKLQSLVEAQLERMYRKVEESGKV